MRLTSRVSEVYNKQTYANAKVDAVGSLGTDFDLLLTRGAVCALAAAGVWALVVLLAVVLEAGSQGRVRLVTGCPVAIRAWLLGIFLAAFAGVGSATAGGTGAGPDGPGRETGPPDGAELAVVLDGLPLPDRIVGTAELVVVHSGDSLWRIARALLPHDAPDAAVAGTVARLYADNRPTIGPDPDLLTPGQRLLVRDGTTLSEES